MPEIDASPASGDGWNEPRTPAHLDVNGFEIPSFTEIHEHIEKESV